MVVGGREGKGGGYQGQLSVSVCFIHDRNMQSQYLGPPLVCLLPEPADRVNLQIADRVSLTIISRLTPGASEPQFDLSNICYALTTHFSIYGVSGIGSGGAGRFDPGGN